MDCEHLTVLVAGFEVRCLRVKASDAKSLPTGEWVILDLTPAVKLSNPSAQIDRLLTHLPELERHSHRRCVGARLVWRLAGESTEAIDGLSTQSRSSLISLYALSAVLGRCEMEAAKAWRALVLKAHRQFQSIAELQSIIDRHSALHLLVRSQSIAVTWMPDSHAEWAWQRGFQN